MLRQNQNIEFILLILQIVLWLSIHILLYFSIENEHEYKSRKREKKTQLAKPYEMMEKSDRKTSISFRYFPSASSLLMLVTDVFVLCAFTRSHTNTIHFMLLLLLFLFFFIILLYS